MEKQVEDSSPIPMVTPVNEPTAVPPPVVKQNNSSIIHWVFLAGLGLVLLVIGIGIGSRFGSSKKLEKDKIMPTVINKKPSVIINGTEPTTTPTEIEAEPTKTQPQQAEAAIKMAFAQKFNKPLDEVEVTVTGYEPGFAKGGVSFGEETGGGWFLAAEVGGQWVIADDGNGTVSCEKIDPYNFPTTLVPECWSDATQDLIQR